MDPEHSVNEEDLPRLLAMDLKRHSERFVECYWSFVGKLAHRFTRSDEDAEDLRQEVFECVLRAFERKEAKDIESIKFRSYLRMATRNCYFNMLRDKYQLAESLDTPAGIAFQEALADENVRYGQPEAAFEDKEFRRKIKELLNTLSWRHRMAVMLRYGWGFGYPDIARALHISEDNAKHLVTYGKRKLKETASVQGYIDESCFT